MSIKVWRHLELSIEVDIASSGKAFTSDVLREVEFALHAGCEYAPQKMRFGLLRAVTFNTPIPIQDDSALNPCGQTKDDVEQDLIELTRLKALYE